ncbi:MAG: ABC transporter substrate-binding protein [Proteobacteria bacterium]|nr:ABC transporter substrate-binding protein [Pseudomonadota bacterium]
MTKMLRRAFSMMALAVLALAAPIAASAQTVMDEILKRGELRVGVQTQGAPVSFVNKNGERTGLAIEIVKSMAKDLGVKLVLQDYDWKGLIPALLAGKVDFIAADMTPTPQRTAQLLFTKPIFFSETVAFAKKDAPFKTWQDLNKAGLNIGGVQGGTYVSAIKEYMPSATVKEFASGPTIAQAVAANRLDAGVTDLGNAGGYVREHGNLKVLEGVMTREPLGFAMRADSAHLKFWLDNYFELMAANNQLKKQLDYWWHSTAWVADHK